MDATRARLVFGLGAAICAAGLTACTLLAHFDDAASTEGPDGSSPLDGPDVSSVDAPVGVDSPGPQTDAHSGGDAHGDAAPGDPCKGEVNGYYCATDGLNGYQGPPNVLIQCGDGGVAKSTTCDAGCLALADPFPDTCNVCDSKANGAYCGRDFSSFPAIDADWLVQCQNSNASQLVACAHGCLSSGGSSSCN